jgi:hypothetical protein
MMSDNHYSDIKAIESNDKFYASVIVSVKVILVFAKKLGSPCSIAGYFLSKIDALDNGLFNSSFFSEGIPLFLMLLVFQLTIIVCH